MKQPMSAAALDARRNARVALAERDAAIAKAMERVIAYDAVLAADAAEAKSPWRFYDAATVAAERAATVAAELKQRADIAFDAATDAASLKAADDIARAAASAAKDARSARAEASALYDAARYDAAQARVARQSFR